MITLSISFLKLRFLQMTPAYTASCEEASKAASISSPMLVKPLLGQVNLFSSTSVL